MFVSYLLQTIDFHTHSGKSGVPGVNRNDLHEIVVSFPSNKAEQEAIAETLSDSDAHIESLEQLIAKKRRFKQGALQELLCPKNGWSIKKLENIADVIDPHPSHRAPTMVPDGIPFVGIGDLHENGDLIGTKIRTVDSSVFDEHLTRYDLKEELIGLGRVASIGKVVKLKWFGEKYVISPTLGVIRGTKVKRDYLLYALQSKAVAYQFNKIMSGSTRSSVGMVVLRKLDIALPIEEAVQSSIAAILSDMDAEIAALEDKLAKARMLKQGMMQELLTGRIRLVDLSAAKAKLLSPLSEENAAAPKPDKRHNWAFNEAVVISVLADQFAKPEFPLGRKRYTKLSYMMHRKAEQDAQGYLKKAAGPYNPKTKYAGPEKIAQENCYLRIHENGKFKGFVAADKIEQAKSYFTKWYGYEITTWLEQFRYKSNDELECLATVDMVMQELMRKGKTVTVDSIRAMIASEPEWLPKLERPTFSDSGIAAALAECHALFAS